MNKNPPASPGDFYWGAASGKSDSFGQLSLVFFARELLKF